MADDGLHLVALGQALQQNHLRAGLARVFMARNRNEGQLVRKIDDLAFEVILVGVDHGDVLPRRQPKHPRVLRVVGCQAQREHRLRLGSEHLVFQKEARQRHDQ